MHFLLPNKQILSVKRTRRKNSVGLNITHEFNRLLVPSSYSDRKITGFIKKEFHWIENTINQQRKRLPSLPEASDFLQEVACFGKIVTIEYIESKQQPALQFNEVSQNLILNVNVLQSPNMVKTEVYKWLVAEITNYLHEQVPIYAKKINVSQQLEEIIIKNYKSRWGSCYLNGRVQFNWRLVMMPKQVVDYVIIHELCHLIHHNHSKQFWVEVAKYCPEFKQHKAWLKQNGSTVMRALG